MKALCDILKLDAKPMPDEWVIVTPGELFEEVAKSNFSDEEIAEAFKQVQQTKEFQDILATGATFTPTKIQVKRGVLRFLYDSNKSYMVYPRGLLRGQENIRASSHQQYKLKTKDIELTNNLLENYKLLLKRLLTVLGKREKARSVKQARADALKKEVSSVGELGLPNTYPANLVLRKRSDIVSLKGSPRTIRGDLDLYMCRNLESLEGGPERVHGQLTLTHCFKLRSLKGAPKHVGSIQVEFVPLTDFEGFPEQVDGLIWATSMPNITSLKGLPKHLKGRSFDFSVSHTNSVSLSGIGTEFILTGDYIRIQADKVTHALGLVLIEGLSEYCKLVFPGGEIIAKYLNEGHDGMIDCQHELIAAGFDEVAKL